MEMMTPDFRAIQVSDTVTFVNLIRKEKGCGEERRIRLNFIKIFFDFPFGYLRTIICPFCSLCFQIFFCDMPA